MVGDAPAIDVMLFDMQIGAVVEQPVEHLCRLARRRGDNGGMERRVAIRDVAVEGDGRFRPLVRIDRAGCLGAPVERKVLTVRTGRGARAEQSGEWCGVLGIDKLGERATVGFLAQML